METGRFRYQVPRSAAAAGEARRVLHDRLADATDEDTIVDAQIVLTEVLGPWLADGSGPAPDIEVRVDLRPAQLGIEIANLGARLVRATTADDLRLSVIRGVARDWGIRGVRDPVFWFELGRPDRAHATRAGDEAGAPRS